jgi:hypothetical protein
MALVAASPELAVDRSVCFVTLFSAIDVFLEHLAWPKCHDATRGNPDFFSSPRVSSLTGTLAPHNKISKPGNFDRFSLLQDRLEQIQHKLHNISRFILRNADLLENFVSDIRLSHATPLRDHCNSPRFNLADQPRDAMSFA